MMEKMRKKGKKSMKNALFLFFFAEIPAKILKNG